MHASMSATSSRRATLTPPTRRRLLRLGLYWGTLFVLVVGSCTLTFWLLVSASGFPALGAPELFVIRAVGLGALTLGMAGIFLIVAGWRRVTLPIREMIESAERIAAGDYAVRVREQGPRELRQLARAFNRMADALSANEKERRTLIANIANELHTPLTMLKENIEGLLDGNFARDDAHLHLILGESIRLSHLVDEMRMLALAESGGLILQREPTDLNALVRETLAKYHRQASARHVALHAVVPDHPVIADVDAGRIQEVLGNLIDHALDARLKSDIRVQVSVPDAALEAPSPYAQVEVAYRGAPTAPNELAGYFDRFWQVESRRAESSDSGLGLAIAKLLVQAHGGTIQLASDPRRGTQIQFTLPLV